MRTKTTQEDLLIFADLLTKWSRSESSYFLNQFYRTFGMSEMQFYKKVEKCKARCEEFDYGEVKKNLRRNRFVRDQRLEEIPVRSPIANIVNEGRKIAEKIKVNFKEGSLT